MADVTKVQNLMKTDEKIQNIVNNSPKVVIKVGRKSTVTKDVLVKLEQAFSLGCTDTEACLYAGISVDSLYRYQEKHPKFHERKLLLKETPILIARNTIIQKLDDPDFAMQFLAKKRKDEFGNVNNGVIVNNNNMVQNNVTLEQSEAEEILANLQNQLLTEAQIIDEK